MSATPFRYFLQLSYQGTHYHGWQIQQNATTVQGVIQQCLAQILRRSVPLVGSSRTDAGVHAWQQFAHMDLTSRVAVDQLHYQLNAVLPPDIAVLSIRPVKPNAHARFHALSRRYEYTLVQTKTPLQQKTSHWLRGAIDLDKMNKAAEILCQKKDFTCFCKGRLADLHGLCTVMEAGWIAQEGKLIFRIQANRFLRGMVRSIVSNLLKIGQGKLSLASFEARIDQKDQHAAASLVPAQGLALKAVTYPAAIFVAQDALRKTTYSFS